MKHKSERVRYAWHGTEFRVTMKRLEKMERVGGENADEIERTSQTNTSMKVHTVLRTHVDERERDNS